MLFETMIKVVKGFNRLDNAIADETSKNKLNKLIKVSKKYGLVEMSEENGDIVLLFGDYNKEMVRIRFKDNKNKTITKLKINANALLSEVVKKRIYVGS